jgi:hypothetical protein
MTSRIRARLGLLLPCACVLLLALPRPAASQQPLVQLGTFVESNYSVQPGVQVGLSSPALFGGAPRLTAAWSSTRLATALGSNALAEDRLQLAAAWRFRRTARVQPFAAVSGGVTRFDRDDDELFALLDNSAPLLSLLFGAEGRVHGPLRLHGHIGYSAIQSSTVYPFVAAVGLAFDVRGGGR